MRKVAIFGGAFNPPTFPHEQIITEISKKFNEVWIIPALVHRQKEKLIPIGHRIEMLYILLDKLKLKNVKVCNFEEDGDFEGKAYLLMEYLKNKYPSKVFYYVLGKQVLNTINKWYEYENFIKENNFYIFSRKGIKSNSNLDLFFFEGKDNIIASTFCTPEVSSKEVRDILNEEMEGSVGELEKIIDKDILDYIFRNSLYKCENFVKNNIKR